MRHARKIEKEISNATFTQSKMEDVNLLASVVNSSTAVIDVKKKGLILDTSPNKEDYNFLEYSNIKLSEGEELLFILRNSSGDAKYWYTNLGIHEIGTWGNKFGKYSDFKAFEKNWQGKFKDKNTGISMSIGESNPNHQKNINRKLFIFIKNRGSKKSN